jgi:ankyrin repeat protein
MSRYGTHVGAQRVVASRAPVDTELEALNVERLACSAAAPRCQDPTRDPLIVIATKLGRLDILKLLFSDGGADANAVNTAGDSALMHAAMRSKRGEFIELLLKEDVDVDAQNKDGKTALMLAVAGGRLPYAKLLVEGGAQVNITDYSKLQPQTGTDGLDSDRPACLPACLPLELRHSTSMFKLLHSGAVTVRRCWLH